MLRRVLKYVLVLVLLLVAIQFIPIDMTNPPVDPNSTFEAVAKPSPAVAALVRRACYNCHSHETVWPWYSRIAPVSWFISDDVKEGRRHLNFSQWNQLSPDVARTRLKDACGEVKEGNMPLRGYLMMHSEARVSSADVETLCGAVNQAP